MMLANRVKHGEYADFATATFVVAWLTIGSCLVGLASESWYMRCKMVDMAEEYPQESAYAFFGRWSLMMCGWVYFVFAYFYL